MIYSRRFSKLALLVGLILGIAVALVRARHPHPLQGVGTGSPRRGGHAADLLPDSPLRVLNVVLIVGVFRGGGEPGFSLAAEGVTMWTIGVPLAFLGAVTLRLPVEQVVLLITLEEIVKCVIALFRLRSNRWLHEVAIGMGEKSRAE